MKSSLNPLIETNHGMVLSEVKGVNQVSMPGSSKAHLPVVLPLKETGSYIYSGKSIKTK